MAKNQSLPPHLSCRNVQLEAGNLLVCLRGGGEGLAALWSICFPPHSPLCPWGPACSWAEGFNTTCAWASGDDFHIWLKIWDGFSPRVDLSPWWLFQSDLASPEPNLAHHGGM